MSELAWRALECSSRELWIWRRIFQGLMVFLIFLVGAVLLQELWWYRGVNHNDRPKLTSFVALIENLKPGDEIVIKATYQEQVLTKAIVAVNNGRNLITYPVGHEEIRTVLDLNTRWRKIVFFNQVAEIHRGEKVLWRRNPPPIFV